MEANLTLRFECDDLNIRRNIVTILKEDSRPTFADEVDEAYRYIFEALEYVESPETIKTPGTTTVHAYFLLHGDYDEDTCNLLEGLYKCKVQRLVTFLEADDDIQLLYEQNGKIKQLDEWDEDRMDDARDDLQSTFTYLDELSKQLY
jgi:hypothetical protein